jgi:hypothetical protein
MAENSSYSNHYNCWYHCGAELLLTDYTPPKKPLQGDVHRAAHVGAMMVYGLLFFDVFSQFLVSYEIYFVSLHRKAFKTY